MPSFFIELMRSRKYRVWLHRAEPFTETHYYCDELWQVKHCIENVILSNNIPSSHGIEEQVEKGDWQEIELSATP